MNENATGQIVPYVVEMFRFQAWMAMGKVANPVSQKVERELPAAKVAIDLLAELETKTRGNLSEDEDKMLQSVLTDLRLNYLEEMKKPEAEAGAAASDEGTDETEENHQHSD